MKALETERLWLRQFSWSDLLETHRLLYADPEVAPGWAGRTRSLDEIHASFGEKVAQQEYDLGFLALVLKQTNQLIGTVGLQPYTKGEADSYLLFETVPGKPVGGDPVFADVELTYALGRVFWGHGYGAEACRAIIAYGFDEMKVGRIVNSVNSENIASINLMRRLGFHLQRNLHPKPFVNSSARGVIGLLEAGTSLQQ